MALHSESQVTESSRLGAGFPRVSERKDDSFFRRNDEGSRSTDLENFSGLVSSLPKVGGPARRNAS
jgi:hypothetical protein